MSIAADSVWRNAYEECSEKLKRLTEERDALRAEVKSACQALQDEQCLTERLEAALKQYADPESWTCGVLAQSCRDNHYNGWRIGQGPDLANAALEGRKP